ncbi:MAG: cytochrome ubiquinol oxidase subunit I [Chlamydiota bacterium]
MDVVVLSRIQFALTSMFHYIYPPLSIGLGLMLIIVEGMYIKTKNPMYQTMAKFWSKIFALTFALGVATGLVQLFGFGTNWARYSRFVGDVFGSALGAEGVFAFFLESGFLGLMLFGWNRISPRMHYFSTWMVALGAHFSALWIVVANSWMQTPAGYKIVGEGINAKAVVTDFWKMIFNPSAIDRVVHVILGCWLAGIFLYLSITAYYYLKKRHLVFAQQSMKIGLICAIITLFLQLGSADSTARGVAVNQPAKLAAMEGVFVTQPYTALNLFGWVDTREQKVIGVGVPGVLSFLTYRNFEQPIKGLDQIPKDEWPNVQAVFQSYHLMIAMWGLMFVITTSAIYYYFRKRLHNAKWVLYGLMFSVLCPQIANQAGWVTAEMGRQPWVVQGLLRTYEGVSKGVSAHQVLGSIIMYLVIFCFLFCVFIYLLDQKIKHGPETKEDEALVYKDRPYNK